MVKNDHAAARNNMAVRELSLLQCINKLRIIPVDTLSYMIFVKKKVKRHGAAILSRLQSYLSCKKNAGSHSMYLYDVMHFFIGVMSAC